MAAKDYEITIGMFHAYLSKKIKSEGLMSSDRRHIEDSEILCLFEFYLRRFCDTNNTDTLVVSAGDRKIFEAKLLDKEERI